MFGLQDLDTAVLDCNNKINRLTFLCYSRFSAPVYAFSVVNIKKCSLRATKFAFATVDNAK